VLNLTASISNANGAVEKTILFRCPAMGAGMRTAALMFWMFISVAPLFAQQRVHLEKWYADALAEQLPGSKREARMSAGTRCDVLATHYAIEVEFADKWYEAVGQAFHYSQQTGRMPAIALILEQSRDEKQLSLLRSAISWQQLPIRVIVLRPFGKDSLTIEYPAGIVGRPAAPARQPVDLSRPVDAMDWIPRFRGSFSFELSTPNPASK
jgi:hypothetical protein